MTTLRQGVSEAGLAPALLRTAAQERALSQTAMQLFSQETADDLPQSAANAVASLVQVDVTVCYLASDADATLTLRAVSDDQGAHLQPPEESSADLLAEAALQHRAINYSTGWLAPTGLNCRAAVAVPIEANDRTLGVIVLGRADAAPFRADHVALISTLGRQIGLALLRSLNDPGEEERARMTVDLVSRAAHEMRTPLTALQGFTELLLRRDVAPEVRREWLGIVNQETVRLSRLIEDMLDLSRIASGRIELTRGPVRLQDIVSRVVRLLDHEAHRIRLSVTELPAIMLDGDKLAQVVTNLLQNALDYSPPGQSVDVAVADRCLAPRGDPAIVASGTVAGDTHYRCGGAASFSVRDTGFGMTPQELGKAFQPFYRADDSQASRPDGSGLGLAIAKAIVQRHGGALWAHSRRGEGSIFGICLPLEAGTV